MLDKNEVKLEEVESQATEPEIKSITNGPSTTAENPPVQKVKGSIMSNRYLIASVIVILVVGGVGFYVYKHNKNLKEQERLTQEEQARVAILEQEEGAERKAAEDAQKLAEEEQMVEKLPTLRETVTISILNGTDIRGLAGSTAESLEEVGYVDVNAGNSPTKDHTTTTVSYIEDLAEVVVSDVVEVLKETFTTVETETFAIEEKGDYEVVVTAGSLLVTDEE